MNTDTPYTTYDSLMTPVHIAGLTPTDIPSEAPVVVSPEKPFESNGEVVKGAVVDSRRKHAIVLRPREKIEEIGRRHLSEIESLWVEFKNDMFNKDLRNRLVEMYLPLVKHNAERIWARLPNAVELDDLISAGVFGLMDAIDAFDLDRGVKFETYCVPRVRGAMLDELRAMDWVPRLVRSKASKLNEAVKTVESREGRPPTEVELAEELGITVPELEKMIMDANAINLISLNKKWYETDSYKDVREIDILEDKKGEDPTLSMQKNDLLRLATLGLNRNERLIVILYYYEGKTMKEIGETLGLCESRVSQMHSDIMKRLHSNEKLRKEAEVGKERQQAA